MRSRNSAIILFVLLIAFLPLQAMAGDYTCPVTPGMDDKHYWQRLVSGIAPSLSVSGEVSGNSLPAYRGPVRTREMTLPEKKEHLAAIFHDKQLLLFNPAHEGTRGLISHMNPARGKLAGLAIGVSLEGLWQYLKHNRADFPVSIAPAKLLDHLGIRTLPALVKIASGKIIIYEGSIGAEHVGGRE